MRLRHAIVWTSIVFCMAVIVFCFEISQPSHAQEPMAIEIVPDPAFQQQIAEATKQIADSSLPASQAWGALGELELREDQEGDERKLTEQLFYFYVRATDSQQIGVLAILHHIDISRATIVQVVIPYLDSKDVGLRESAKGILDLDLLRGPIRAGSNLGYGSFVDALSESPPKSTGTDALIVRYMFEDAGKNGSTAGVLGSLLPPHKSDRQRWQPVRWAEHVISDAIWRNENGFEKKFEQVKPEAIAELEKLSRHEEWWVRLYVAEIIRRHPELRTDAVADRLRDDHNEVVRDVMKKIDTK